MPKIAEIRKIERTDGRKRWGISIPQDKGKRNRVFFDTARKRDFEFQRLKDLKANEGQSVLNMSAADAVLVKDLRKMLPEDVDPREAVRYYLKHHKPEISIPLSQAIDEFIKKQESRNISLTHLKHQRLHLDRLQASVGQCNVSDVTRKNIIGLLDELTKIYAPRTVSDHRKNLSTFFIWSLKNKYCNESPVEGIEDAVLHELEPEYMPVDDVRKFFTIAQEIYPEIVPSLALSFFAGMRSAGIERIEREDLNFELKGIRHRGFQHKKKRRYFVQGFEDNLWQWLEPWRNLKELPKLPNSTFISRRKIIYIAARVEFPHNAGRHSFCTYHVAMNGSADKTATLLTHRGSVATLYDHYCGNSTKQDAEKYFAIIPEA